MTATMLVDRILDQERAGLLDLVSELVRTNSQIPPHGDERAVVDVVRQRAEAMGLGSGELIAHDSSRPNLVLRIPGGDGPRLLLCGHLDTKPVGDAGPQWRTDPLVPTVIDGQLYGLGAADMKAACAAMLYAACALVAAGALRGDLVLALVADEEAGAGQGSKILAPRLAAAVDACLIGEPSGWERDWQGLHVLSRGLSCFRVVVGGTQMHSSLSDRMPSVNASAKLAELLLRLPVELELDWPQHSLGEQVAPTLNAGVTLSGGVYYGVVPGRAEFGCDLRTVPGMSLASVDAALRRWADRARAADPTLELDISYEPNLTWIPSAEIPLDHPLVRAAQQASAHVLDATLPLSMFPGTTDAPWYTAAGIPTIPSLGPGILTCCHGPNESVAVPAIEQAARIYAHTVLEYQSTSCG